MFRTGQNVPAADIDQYLPELRAYIKVHTQPEEKPEAGHPFLENVRYSRAPVFYEDNGRPCCRRWKCAASGLIWSCYADCYFQVVDLRCHDG